MLRASLVCVAGLVLAACGGQEEGAQQMRATPVTTVVARLGQVEVEQPTVGRLEAPGVPTVSAETPGRIVGVRKDVGDTVEAGAVLAELDGEVQRLAADSARAAVERLEVLIENQARTVGRLEDLARQQSVSQSMLDDARAERAALAAQLREAQARLADAEYNLEKTTIRSPAAAAVQRRLVSVGDYVAVGDPIFELVAPGLLQAFLPFPQHLADTLQVGQTVRLQRPGHPSEVVEGTVSDMRPLVGTASRAIEAIVNLENPGGWRAGASISATVITARREGVLVPISTVVRRPAGSVVYVVDGTVASQRVVQTGDRTGGAIEIVSGLAPGEVVVDVGAGFLTDGTPIRVREEAAQSGRSQTAPGSPATGPSSGSAAGIAQ